MKNLLIEKLSISERNYLLKYSVPVELIAGDLLYVAGQPIKQVYFPLEGIIAQTMSHHDAPTLQLSLIGNEGMLGATLLLGIEEASTTSVVCCAGSALTMSASQFARALCQNSELMQTLHHYLFADMQRWAQSVYCINFHKIKARLARLLLMINRRIQEKKVGLTQQMLANLLGVTESSISVAVELFQQQGLIIIQRGQIEIRNHSRLSKEACSCSQYQNSN